MRLWTVAAVALAFPASAQMPPRPIGIERQAAAPLPEVQECLAKWIKPLGIAVPQTSDDGVSMLVEPRQLIAGANAPFMAIHIRDDGATRWVTMTYRHPWNAKAARNMLKNGAKKCQLGEEVPAVSN